MSSDRTLSMIAGQLMMATMVIMTLTSGVFSNRIAQARSSKGKKFRPADRLLFKIKCL